MHNNLYSIGEISKMKDITVKALHFYDKIGLLKPYYIDPSTQYRYYHSNQMLQLDVIKAARSLDISPSDLIPLFHNKDTSGMLKLLKNHQSKIYEKLRKLQDVAAGIGCIINNFEYAREVSDQSQIYQRDFPARHILLLPYTEYENPDDILNDFSRLDMLINELEGIATCESGVLYKRKSDTVYPASIFAGIAKPLSSLQYLCIPEGRFLCTNFMQNNVASKQQLFFDYLSEHRLEYDTVIQVELLYELFSEEQSVYELQVRIS